MADTKKEHGYVFRIIQDNVVEIKIINAFSQTEAELILINSDPYCTFDFLWIQPVKEFEQDQVNIWLRIFLIFAAIFLVTAGVLFLFRMSNFSYLLYAGLSCLVCAAVYQAGRYAKQ
jgi:hypothetical protein